MCDRSTACRSLLLLLLAALAAGCTSASEYYRRGMATRDLAEKSDPLRNSKTHGLRSAGRDLFARSRAGQGRAW